MMPPFRVYWKAFKVSLQTKLEYRADFILGVGGALGLQLAGLGALWVVLAQRPSLMGWQSGEVALLFGLTTMIQGFSELAFNHIWYVPIYILRGQIDRLLVYPVRSLPFFLITSPELHALGNLAGGLAIYILAGRSLHAPWWAYAFLPFWILCGSVIHSAFLVLCAALSFKVLGQKAQHFFIVNSLLSATRYPLTVFPYAMQLLLLVFMPMATANFLPIGFITKGFPALAAFGAPLLAALLSSWLAHLGWEAGLKRYEGTGS
jgi:ABC-2 type transport system permease protein